MTANTADPGPRTDPPGRAMVCPEEVLVAAVTELHRRWGYDELLNPLQLQDQIRSYIDSTDTARLIADHAYRAGFTAALAVAAR